MSETRALIWKRATVPGRGDIVGVRTVEGGGQEYIIYNEVLCETYYLATDGHSETVYELYYKLLKAEAELARAREALQLVNQEWHHSAPGDCYSTGPVVDHLGCPGCEVQRHIEAALSPSSTEEVGR